MSKTVLIVDDSTSLRQVVSMTLKSQGFDVVEGCDGKDALTKLLTTEHWEHSCLHWASVQPLLR